MGVAAIDALQAGLLQALPADTPAAVVQHASLPQQRQLVCTLGNLAAQVRSEGIGSPAIVIVDKIRPTPPAYPRRAGVPARKPL